MDKLTLREKIIYIVLIVDITVLVKGKHIIETHFSESHISETNIS